MTTPAHRGTWCRVSQLTTGSRPRGHEEGHPDQDQHRSRLDDELGEADGDSDTGGSGQPDEKRRPPVHRRHARFRLTEPEPGLSSAGSLVPARRRFMGAGSCFGRVAMGI